MTAAELRFAERNFQRATKRWETQREARNNAVRQAFADGWTNTEISKVTGLTRGRISQIAQAH